MAPSERLLSCSGTFTITWLPLELSLSSQIMWKVPGRQLSFIADDYSTIAEQFQVASERCLASLTLLLHTAPCYVRYTFSHKFQAEFKKVILLSAFVWCPVQITSHCIKIPNPPISRYPSLDFARRCCSKVSLSVSFSGSLWFILMTQGLQLKGKPARGTDATFAWSKLCRIVLFVWVGWGGEKVSGGGQDMAVPRMLSEYLWIPLY